MANSARPTTNLLEYIPYKDALSQEAWNDNAALMIYKLFKSLQLAAKMYPVIDPKTSARYIADWTLVENFATTSAMSTYPGGQGAVNVGVRKNMNDLLHTYIIKLLTPYWASIEKALNVQEYDDDASPLHVRDAHGNIVERMPLVPLLIGMLKQKTFKGPVISNKNLEVRIQSFRGPKDASDQALTSRSGAQMTTTSSPQTFSSMTSVRPSSGPA